MQLHAGRIVALALIPACRGPDPEAPAVDPHPPAESYFPGKDWRYRTKYLNIETYFAAPICAGTLAHLDAHIEAVGHDLGISLDPEMDRINVFVRGDKAPGEPWCAGTGLCYENDRRSVFSSIRYAMYHELVHALTVGSRGTSYWSENITEAYEGTFEPYRELWRDDPEWPPAFWRNGHWARWLIAEYGGELFMDYFDETEPDADQSGVEAATRAVYGVELDDLLDDYAASAPFVFQNEVRCYVAPGTAEVPWVQDRWESELTIDCAAPTTFTADDLITRMSARVPFTIAEAGKYRFNADHPDAEITIDLCLTEPVQQEIDLIWPKPSHPLLSAPTLSPGSYVLEVSVPLGDPVKVRVQGSPAVEEETVP